MQPGDSLRPKYDLELGDLAHDSGSRGRVFRALPGGSRVLDVGCDTGRLGDALKKLKGCAVDGMEPDPGAAGEARRRLDRVFAKSADEPGAFEGLGPYDAVLFLDVLEHLVDPWRALRGAASVLRPGGAVHVVAPNIAHVSVVRRLLTGRFEYADFGTMDRTHLRWFTRASLRACFEQAALERIDVTVIPIVPWLDASRAGGAAAARALGALLPDAFGGSLYAVGFAPVPA
jgi:SAM-dependent methyltransferase